MHQNLNNLKPTTLLDDRIDASLAEEITAWLKVNAKPDTRLRVIRRAIHRKFGKRIQASIFNRRAQERAALDASNKNQKP